MILAQLAHFASHTVNSLAFFQEEQTVSFSPMGLWEHMGWPARCIAIILFIESIWSLAVMIDRYLYFSAARKQSREFAPKVAGALKDSKLEEAIKIADRNKKSHLAEVVTAGLQEFRASGGTATEETIASSGRALERAEAIVHAKLKRGLCGTGHHRLHGSLRRTVRHRHRHSERLPADRHPEDFGHRRGRRRHFRSTCYHGVRPSRGHPRRYGIQLLHRPRRVVRRGDGQLLQRTDRLLHQAEPQALSEAAAGSSEKLAEGGRADNSLLPAGFPLGTGQLFSVKYRRRSGIKILDVRSPNNGNRGT